MENAEKLKHIWYKVYSLPEGQDKVVMEQLWQLSKDTSPTLKDYPAIFEHGFLIEEELNGRKRLRPFSSSLNEFSRKYIGISSESGYRLKTFTESDTPEEPKHNSLNRHSSLPFRL